MSTSPTHPRTIGLILGVVLLAWGAGTPLAWGQGKTSVRLYSIGNPELRIAAEKSASAAITAINRAVALSEERPDLSDAPVTDRGRKAILSRWDQASFYCNRTDLARSLARRAGGTYEIRGIPLLVGDNREQRSGILLLNDAGTVIGFRYGSEPATGTITIASEPSGATVVGAFGDSSTTREAPAQFSEVPAGQHRFTVRKETYETVDTTLVVAAGRSQTVTVLLEEKIFENHEVEDQAEPIGGSTAVQKAVDYPEAAKDNGIEGRVIVQFVVNESGDVQNSKVVRGVHKLLNKEAVEAVRELQFKPGEQHGEPVKVRRKLAIKFQSRR